MTIPSNSNRLDYLDAVRAFALILGIVFHASLSFMPIFIGWAVMDVSTSPVVPVFALISHSFRMELFFLIAGFFSHMTFHGKGAATFLKSRLVRIAIPFVVGWFIMRPLLVAGWIMGGESMRGDVHILSGFMAGFASLRDLPTGLFVGSHLWFLYYLLLMTAATLLLRAIVGWSKPAGDAVTRVADATTGWIANSRIALFAVAIPTAACLWFMPHWGMDTPDKTLTPHIPVSLVYAGFFMLGWLLHRQKHLIERFARLSWGTVTLAVVATIATAFLSRFAWESDHEHYTLLKASFALGYSLMMWSLVVVTIALFKRFLDRPSKTVRYVADSSYWLYLVHLPIVVWLQVAFAELSWHWSAKLAAISIITILVSILLYDLFVRSTFLGATLNGKRKPRVLFRFGPGHQSTPQTGLTPAGESE